VRLQVLSTSKSDGQIQLVVGGLQELPTGCFIQRNRTHEWQARTLLKKDRLTAFLNVWSIAGASAEIRAKNTIQIARVKQLRKKGGVVRP
jgi:hypothetical protein